MTAGSRRVNNYEKWAQDPKPPPCHHAAVKALHRPGENLHAQLAFTQNDGPECTVQPTGKGENIYACLFRKISIKMMEKARRHDHGQSSAPTPSCQPVVGSWGKVLSHQGSSLLTCKKRGCKESLWAPPCSALPSHLRPLKPREPAAHSPKTAGKWESGQFNTTCSTF